MRKNKKNDMYKASPESDYEPTQRYHNSPSRKTKYPRYTTSPSRTVKYPKYKRDYIYSDEDEDDYEYNNDQYDDNYKYQMFDTTSATSDYMIKESSPHYRRRLAMETEGIEGSESDFEIYNKGKKEKLTYYSKPPSIYRYEENKPVYRHRYEYKQDRRKRKGSETQLQKHSYRYRLKRSPDQRNVYDEELDEELYEDLDEEVDEATDEGSNNKKHFRNVQTENPYRRNIGQNVYYTHQPIGQKAFRYKKQREKEEEHSSDLASEMIPDEELEEEENEMPKRRKQRSQYQVYAANTKENKSMFKNQQKQAQNQLDLQKTSTTSDYNKITPEVSFRREKTNEAQDKSSSTVYLPVVITDDGLNIRLPKSKIVKAESLISNLKEKGEKPLETISEATEKELVNIVNTLQNDYVKNNATLLIPQVPMRKRSEEVYVVNQHSQKNIFNQAQKNNSTIYGEVQNNKQPLMVQNYEVYRTKSVTNDPTKQKSSIFSRKFSKRVTKDNTIDYPVNKSYISVATPSQQKSIKKKKSENSVKSLESKTSKGSNTSVRSLGKCHKKNKLKKKKKDKTKEIDPDAMSTVISVTNPEPFEHEAQHALGQEQNSYEQKTHSMNMGMGNMGKPSTDRTNTTRSILHKHPTQDQQSSVLGNVIPQPTIDRRNTLNKSVDRRSITSGTIHRKDSEVKAVTNRQGSIASTTSKMVERKDSKLERQCSKANKNSIITIKGVPKVQSKIDESQQFFERNDLDTVPSQTEMADPEPRRTPKKRSIFKSKSTDSKAAINQHDDSMHTGYHDHSFLPSKQEQKLVSPTPTPTTPLPSKKLHGRHSRNTSMPGSRSKLRSVDFNPKDEEFQIGIMKVLSFHSKPNILACLNQAVQYFLGLSMHGTLMDVFRNFK